MSAYSWRTSLKTRCQRSWAKVIALDLSLMHTRFAVLVRVFERITDNALDAFAGVDVLLNGNLVRRALLEKPANANVEALRVFTEHHQANVFFGAVAQWREPIVQELHRPGVDVQVELEPQTQKDVGSVLIRRDPRVAQRAEKDGVKLIAEHLE